MPDAKIPPYNTIGHLITHAMKGLRKQLNHNFESAGFQITREHWLVIVYSKRAELGCMQGEIVDLFMGDKTAVTRVVTDLENKDWITREICGHDRRHKRITLTEEGNRIFPQLKRIAEQTLSDAVNTIDANALETCKQVLAQMIANLQVNEL